MPDDRQNRGREPDRRGRSERTIRGTRRERPDRGERGDSEERTLRGRSGRGEPRETLSRIEQRPPFVRRPAEWGRPDYARGERVEWNFLYKLANTSETRGTITRVGETCDIRWDDGLETLFMPPLVLRSLQAGEEAGRTDDLATDAGLFDEEAGAEEL